MHRPQAYANDQDSPDTLIAVTEASNRSKADKDPAEWLPSDTSYHCTYAATWVGTKLRWDLAADEDERQALFGLAALKVQVRKCPPRRRGGVPVSAELVDPGQG